ncbi:PRC-barrel domain-containing protein [Rhodospirillaceae bacterium SYSU D60014]|uniref:PRC-barrel domain-containing protein n=1 Tax=Virgifigura deserti TaxID=2268457 RepID=UPI000E662F2F
MLKHLLSTTAIVLALSTTAWAQTSTAEDPAMDQGQTTEEMNAQPTDQPDSATGTDMEDPAAGTAETDMPDPTMEEPAADTAATDTQDAVIPAEEEGQLRAENLMGMTVLSGDGERIGEVQDLIFDESEQITGVVVGVGGFLGIGEKRVGLNWEQAEVQQNPDTNEEVITVNLSREELEAAPEFQTTEEQAAEEEAGAVAPLPEPTTGTAPQ